MRTSNSLALTNFIKAFKIKANIPKTDLNSLMQSFTYSELVSSLKSIEKLLADKSRISKNDVAILTLKREILTDELNVRKTLA